MNLFRLAAAWLTTRRVAIVAVVISALGVMAMITVVALMDGVQRFLEDHLRGASSDVVLVPPAFLTTGERLAEMGRLANELGGEEGLIRALAPRDTWIALGWSEQGGDVDDRAIMGFQLLGIDLEREREVAPVEDVIRRVEDGRLRMSGALSNAALDPGPDGIPGIIVGDDLARALGVQQIGELIRLSVVRGDVDSTGGENPTEVDADDVARYVRTRTLRVVGTFSTGREAYDRLTAWVDRRVLHAMRLERPGPIPRITTMHAALVDPDDYRAAILKLKARLPGWTVNGWRKFDNGELQAVKDQKRIFVVILSFITVAGSAGVCGMVFTMVREKTRDIGILRSMGLSRSRMVLGFTIYGLYLGICGSVLGLGLGLALTDRLDAVIAWLSDLFGVQLLNPEVYPFESVPTHIDPAAVATIIVATVGMSFLAALLPALRAGRLSPVRALRSD